MKTTMRCMRFTNSRRLASCLMAYGLLALCLALAASCRTSRPPAAPEPRGIEKAAAPRNAVPALLACQLLMTREEEERLHINQQRSIYPAEARRRISAKAARDGFNTLGEDPAKAMEHFNQAWRFSPDNPMAYWGAAIIRGLETIKYKGLTAEAKAWNDAMELIGKAEPLMGSAPKQLKMEFDLDRAEFRFGFAKYLRQTGGDGKAKSDTMLVEAGKILESYVACILFSTDINKMVSGRASWQLSRVLELQGRKKEAGQMQKRYKELGFTPPPQATPGTLPQASPGQ